MKKVLWENGVVMLRR
ncbi:hypothetical protein PMLGA01_090011100 [Plasmodium malariae]|uniref:Uncharacterized protein n=1 Tax=Plasmodium malariae TaxID=5858 RepID=A0A1C3KCA7_PLAMA|nr:hypothetical protein PMLGA01_090011100 [Plasmodium malariae]